VWREERSVDRTASFHMKHNTYSPEERFTLTFKFTASSLNHDLVDHLALYITHLTGTGRVSCRTFVEHT
jgi:hypothetical protein